MNNLVVDTEVGHTSDKKEEIDCKVWETLNNPGVVIEDPTDSGVGEQPGLCSIVVGNCSEEDSDRNCFDCDQMSENCHKIVVVEIYYNHLKSVSGFEVRRPANVVEEVLYN